MRNEISTKQNEIGLTKINQNENRGLTCLSYWMNMKNIYFFESKHQLERPDLDKI